MLIFGCGHRTRNIEATIARACDKCGQSQVFSLERVRNWLTLLCIPMVPYDTQYWLMCAECRSGFRLSQEEYDELRAEMAASENQHAYMTLTRT